MVTWCCSQDRQTAIPATIGEKSPFHSLTRSPGKPAKCEMGRADEASGPRPLIHPGLGPRYRLLPIYLPEPRIGASKTSGTPLRPSAQAGNM